MFKYCLWYDKKRICNLIARLWVAKLFENYLIQRQHSREKCYCWQRAALENNENSPRAFNELFLKYPISRGMIHIWPRVRRKECRGMWRKFTTCQDCKSHGLEMKLSSSFNGNNHLWKLVDSLCSLGSSVLCLKSAEKKHDSITANSWDCADMT